MAGVIWLLQLAAILVIAGLLIGIAYEAQALARDPKETITAIVRRWIVKHRILAQLLTAVILLFLVLLTLHLFNAIS